MSNQNNVPTGPGWWYRGNTIVLVVEMKTASNGLAYFMAGESVARGVYADGLWAGPVPMPGEWVSVEQYDSDMADCARVITNGHKPTGWRL